MAQASCNGDSTQNTSMNFEPVVTEISREEYLQAIMRREGLTYEEAAASTPADMPRSYDEVLKYATVENQAYLIKDLNGTYTEPVMISAYICYVYNRALGEAVSIENVSAPFAYLRNVANLNVEFEHGDYSVERNSSSKYTITVLGRFIYTVDGVTITVGGDIVSVSEDVGGYRTATKVLTLQTNFTLSQLG